MKIELLNVRIFISKSTVVTDAIGNRRNEWKPFYTCYATVSGEAGKEQTDAGMVVDDSNIDFTIRWCKKAAEIDSILTDHLHTMLAQTLDIYLDEFAFNLVGHAIGKLLGIEVVYLRVIRSTGGVHGIGLFDCIGFGFEFQIVIHREREAALFQFDRPTRKLGVILTVHSRTENGEVITPVYSANGTTAFINGNNLQDGKIVIKSDTKRVTDEEASKHKRCLTKDTVLLSINGTIGNVEFYDGEHVILGKSACYFNLLSGVSKEYVRLVLETDYFARYAVSVATGTTIKNVPLAGMRNLLRRPVQWVCGAV